MLSILNDILDFSKLEAGKYELDKNPFDLKLLAENIHAIFEHQLTEKKLDFDLDMDNSIPPKLCGDEGILRQVLLNLIGNAIKFTKTGSVSLAIKNPTEELKEMNPPASESRKTNNTIRLNFCVSDTGIGISQQKLKRLFKPFSQGDKSTTRQYGGTGLGLVISNKFVELLGGNLDIESTTGEGTKVYFQVNLELPEAEENSGHHEISPEKVNNVLQGKLILLVDDNEVNCFVGEKMLRRLGLNVETCHDGLEALEKVRRNKFDAILMDCQMPRMDGFEATEKIHSIKGLEPLIIIALSAGVTSKERQQCKTAGMNDFLSKPLRIEALEETLNRWL